MKTMILNVECPQCSETFEDIDDVYGTSCGHLFHFGCLNDWRRRYTSCPKCYNYCPSSFKIYLDLGKSGGNLCNQAKKLESYNKKINQLFAQLHLTEANSLKLQRHLAAVENTKGNLEQKIQKMADSEESIWHLQRRYIECVRQVNELEKRINQQIMKNNGKSKELQLKRVENAALKANLATNQANSDALLNETINNLEQKLKHISGEFAKEITKSTQLSIENMKLKSYLDISSSMEDNIQEEPVEEAAADELNEVPTIFFDKTEDAENCPTYNVVLIKQLPIDEIEVPLANVVIKMAKIIDMSLTLNDIIKANLINLIDYSTVVQMLVQFKSNKIKDEFLSNQSKLKDYYPLNECPVVEDLHELFNYAKDALLNTVCTVVFCKNYNIYCKLIDNQADFVHIESKSQVDDLYFRHIDLNGIPPLFQSLNIAEEE